MADTAPSAASTTGTTVASTKRGGGSAGGKSLFSTAYLLEHAVYLVYLLGLYIFLAPLAMKECADACDANPACERRLSEGWLPWTDRKVDLSDAQWHDLRTSASTLTLVAAVFLVLSRLVRLGRNPARRRIIFYVVFSLVTLVYLHGSGVAWVLLFVTINFVLVRATGNKVVRFGAGSGQPWVVGLTPLVVWLFAIAVMFIREWYYNWFRFGNFIPALAFLDEYQGVYRWHAGFNLIILRMISFGMDYYWQYFPSSKEITAPALSYEWREATPLKAATYSYLNYLAYLLYLPLLLAGPTITFNAFMSQIQKEHTSYTPKGIVIYALRWLFAATLLDLLLHYLPVYAIGAAGVYAGMSPFLVGFVGYSTLQVLWLKFLVLWRFFRLWALIDGVETVENMNRCVNNNYSLSGFWRSWHRSFNRWLVRYIYVPLGGNKRHMLFNTFVVFSFVALWHDMTFKLLAWGWLLALFFVPEKLLSGWASHQPWLINAPYYRYVAGLGATANISFLMIANLVGFSVGTDGVMQMLRRLFSIESWYVVVLTLLAFFSASQIMFLYRDWEASRKASSNKF